MLALLEKVRKLNLMFAYISLSAEVGVERGGKFHMSSLVKEHVYLSEGDRSQIKISAFD